MILLLDPHLSFPFRMPAGNIPRFQDIVLATHWLYKAFFETQCFPKVENPSDQRNLERIQLACQAFGAELRLVQEVAKPQDPRCQKSLDLLKVSNSSKYRVWTSTGDCAKAIWNMKLLSHEKNCCSTLHTLHCNQSVTYRRIHFRICFGSF